MRTIHLAVAVALLAAAPAAATPVRIDFSGTFSAALDPAGLLDGLDLGTPFAGFVEYDSSWRASFQGNYSSPTASSGRIRITFAGGNTTRLGEVRVSVVNDGPHGDELLVSSMFAPTSVIFTPTEILRFDLVIVAFRDPTGAMFSNEFLPGAMPPDLAAQVETQGCRWSAPTQFQPCNALVEDTFLATLRIDSYTMVPEPASALLVALGISLLARVRSRYGAHTNCAQ